VALEQDQGRNARDADALLDASQSDTIALEYADYRQLADAERK
jgi:hypothetical protein